MEPNTPAGPELPQFEFPATSRKLDEALPSVQGVREQAANDSSAKEHVLNNSLERGESHYERESAPAQSIPSLSQPPTTLPPLPQVSPQLNDDTLSYGAATDDMPIVANDDDLIEKEWVDRAKKIIQDTKDDPRRREDEISRLQADYIKKRYGREIGIAP